MAMKPVVLSLYRTLFRKARLATKGQEHLFRFQRQPVPDLWGKWLMYDIKYDRKLLQKIFPSSIHPFLDNKYPFDPHSFDDAEGENKLHAEFYPDYVKDPNFDHGFNAVTKEEKLKQNITKNSTPSSSALYSRNRAAAAQKEPKQADEQHSEEDEAADIEHGYILNEYDYYRLKQTIKSIFHHYRHEGDEHRINELINDGFHVLKELDFQIALNECTSIAESNGIRVIATSNYVPTVIGHDPYKPYSFTYRIRIENHGHSWVQLLGRHWIIVDNNGNKEVLERFQPAVVGVQPQLNPGDVFVYGSGTFMATAKGKMYGAFQFTKMDGELFEVPVATFKLLAKTSEGDVDEETNNQPDLVNKS